MSASTNSLSYQRHASSAGFTLIELMVTIAVMAIIVSIAAPNISTQLANQRVKSTTATLANALKEAKAESIIRRQDISFTYDNDGANAGTIKTAQGTTNIANYTYDDKITISDSATKTKITFSPSKRVDNENTYTICDTNTAATPRQVSISKLANISVKTVGSTSC